MSGMSSSLMQAFGEPLRIVWRHGGRSTDHWRLVLRTYSLAEAERKYQREHEQLRQGTVRLVEYTEQSCMKDAGRVLRESIAPRLRTRLTQKWTYKAGR